MTLSVVGVDLSKSVFQLSIADARHRVVDRKRSKGSVTNANVNGSRLSPTPLFIVKNERFKQTIDLLDEPVQPRLKVVK